MDITQFIDKEKLKKIDNAINNGTDEEAQEAFIEVITDLQTKTEELVELGTQVTTAEFHAHNLAVGKDGYVPSNYGLSQRDLKRAKEVIEFISTIKSMFFPMYKSGVNEFVRLTGIKKRKLHDILDKTITPSEEELQLLVGAIEHITNTRRPVNNKKNKSNSIHMNK